jgi:hypothetical protein
MDAQTRGRVVATLRWLAAELQRDRHELAHVPQALAAVVADGRPSSGCKRCGGPIELVRAGRPRLHCERCRLPRRKAPKSDQSPG